jgi:hypothetical protein
LFQGEDFFVEFRRRAYTPDALNSKDKLMSQYRYLDSSLNPSGGTVFNAGVVDVDKDNQIVEESRPTFDFNAQPYYIIEIGSGTNDHYFIILAQNAKPRLVHVADNVPVVNITTTLTVAQPLFECSRTLGIYNEVSSKDLMDKDVMRIQVRQHLGALVITFAGYEGKPWVISRTDPVEINGQQGTGSAPADYKEEVIPMLIAAAPVSLYAGNLKVAWSFGPLVYEHKANITIPQAVVVKGPVSKPEISLRLSEQMTYPNVTDPKLKYVYYQDAEEYYESFGGSDDVKIVQFQVQPTVVQKRGKAPDKAVSPNASLANSAIYITPKTSLTEAGGATGPSSNGAGAGSLNTGAPYPPA